MLNVVAIVECARLAVNGHDERKHLVMQLVDVVGGEERHSPSLKSAVVTVNEEERAVFQGIRQVVAVVVPL